MIFTEKIQMGINCVSRIHREQIRKDVHKTPYASHLFSVMFILATYTEDEDVLLAGLFHDSLEDVPGYTYEKLVADTNTRVADIVRGVTEELNPNIPEDMQLPWLMRKENYIANLRTAPLESVYVSVADKTHNIMSILLGFKESDEERMKKFHASLKNMTWFFEEIEKVAQERLEENNSLLQQMSQSLSLLKEKLA